MHAREGCSQGVDSISCGSSRRVCGTAENFGDVYIGKATQIVVSDGLALFVWKFIDRIPKVMIHAPRYTYGRGLFR